MEEVSNVSLREEKDESTLEKDSTNSDPTIFYFESDHLALKGNSDYLKLMGSLVNLEAVKIKSIKDIDDLFQAKKAALADPLQFVKQLSAGCLNFPDKLRVPDVPEVDWAKYKLTENVTKRPLKRTSKQAFEEDFRLTDDVYVRGRVYKSDKPRTFNQPWRNEEQRRLEELLETFPSEEVEMERWKKIAKELGNRSPVQVQSRVQKYFLKLQRAGLPIPGRAPPSRNKNRYLKPALKKKFIKPPLLLSNSSTFLTSVVPSVRMDDNEDDDDDDEFLVPEPPDHDAAAEDRLCVDNVDLPDADRDSEEYAQLLLLQRVRTESLHELEAGSAEHEGFSCDHCASDPILGTRWHCTTCLNTDFCNLCVVDSNHDPKHTLSRIRNSEIK